MTNQDPEYHRDILKHDVKKYGFKETNGVDAAIWIECHDCKIKWGLLNRPIREEL